MPSPAGTRSPRVRWYPREALLPMRELGLNGGRDSYGWDWEERREGGKLKKKKYIFGRKKNSVSHILVLL